MSPEVRRTQGPCERMRLQFLITKTIGHELAHAFYPSRNRIGSLEPYVHQFDPVEEVGLSWQAWQFGTPGITCNWSLERLGVVFSQTHNFCLAWPRLESPVKMAWVESWFLKSTWDHIEEAVANNMLKAPCAIGQPEWFIANRYVDKIWGTCVYQNGKMTARPSTGLHLPISSPPEDMCVETWYQGVLSIEIRKSIEEGSTKPEDFKVPFEVYLKRKKKARGQSLGTEGRSRGALEQSYVAWDMTNTALQQLIKRESLLHTTYSRFWYFSLDEVALSEYAKGMRTCSIHYSP